MRKSCGTCGAMLGLGCHVRVVMLFCIDYDCHRFSSAEQVEAVLVQHIKLPIKLYYMKIPLWYLFVIERLCFPSTG